MIGLLSLAPLLLLAGEVELNASVLAETRGGEGPIQSPESPRAGFIGVLAPAAELDVQAPTLDLKLEYSPRIFWRQPNESGACPISTPTCTPDMRASRVGPLVLHTVNLLATARATQATTLSGGGTLSVGEPDYSSLPLIIGAMNAAQAALPAVVKILAVSGRAGVEVAVGRRWVLAAGTEVAHRRPIGDQPTMLVTTVDGQMLSVNVSPFPKQTTLRFDPTATAHLSRRDDLLLVDTVSFQTYQPGRDFLTVTPQVGWKRLLTRESDLRLLAGITYVTSWRAAGEAMQPTSGQPMPGEPRPWSPVGSAELRLRAWRGRGFAVGASVQGTVEYYIDPVLAEATPRGTAIVRWGALFGDDWSASIEGMFGTSLSSKPLTALMQGNGTFLPPDETVVAVTLPIRHRVSNNLIVEFGGRWSDRAPHLSVSTLGFHQRQLWAYLALTATTKTPNRWTNP